MILEFRGKKPAIDPSCFVAPSATVLGDTIVSEKTLILFGAVCRADINQILIGPLCCIQDNAVLHPVPNEPVIIEAGTIIGYGSIVHGGTIKNNVLIGAGSIIMPGVQIGPESIVAAGTTLTPGTKIPPRSLVVGTPGKIARPLEKSDIAWARQGLASYQKLLPDYKRQEIGW